MERDHEELMLSVAAQLVGAMRTLPVERQAETLEAYLAGEVVLGLSRDGLRVIPVVDLPDPDYVPGYL